MDGKTRDKIVIFHKIHRMADQEFSNTIEKDIIFFKDIIWLNNFDL